MWSRLRDLFGQPAAEIPTRPKLLGRVTADATRCVQCGICGYNCPVGIDVRSHARQGLPVEAPTCLTCGNCINVCPRGTLRWETLPSNGASS